jgi:acylphosphatase
MTGPTPGRAPTECRLLRVEGRVQGVGYRDHCLRQAQALGLAGWVRNRRDGTVEVLLQGPADDVAKMEACLRQGPRAARVDRVTATVPPAPQARLDAFELRPTE